MSALLVALIYIAFFALALHLVIYVLTRVGVPFPPNVIPIVWLIFGLFALLWLFQAFGTSLHLPSLR